MRNRTGRAISACEIFLIDNADMGGKSRMVWRFLRIDNSFVKGV